MKTILTTAALSAALIPFASAANLSLLVDGGLSNFDTALGVGSRSDVALTGLIAGDSLVGLDYRPATGVTYGISNNSNIYTVNVVTGAATQLGGTLSPSFIGATFGFDYNPVLGGGQFARVISDTNNNVVIDGDAGGYLGGPKTNVFYALGDANEGIDPEINHIAYTNSVFGASSTQQYGIDTGLGTLTTVANNAGTLETVGSLGFLPSSLGGFDIEGATGTAYAAFADGNGLTSTLYTIDLGSGAATEVFTFSGTARGLTSVPEPSSALLMSLAGLGLVLRRKR